METSPNLTLSHLELRVADIRKMERFYAEVLGFIATDRSDGENEMVFLSRSPDEHHQIVLSPGGGAMDRKGRWTTLRFGSIHSMR